MAQETYLIAKTVLRRVKASSEAPVIEFVSPTALAACLRAGHNIQHLSITPEEQEVLDQSNSIEGVQDFIAQYLAEVDKRNHNKTWKKVYSFSRFAGPVLDVFRQANFSPECSLALGLVGLLLIQPLNNKSEIEDKLEAQIGEIEGILSQVQFSKKNIHIVEIDIEIQGLCAAIIDFLLHALHYQKKSGIVKVLGGIISDFAKRFQTYVSKIKGHANKIETLAQRGYTTALLDSKETLEKAAQTIQDLQAHVVAQATIFDIRVARLDENIAQCRQAIETSSSFAAILHVQNLSEIIFPMAPSPESETVSIRQQETLLAPRERWDANVSEIQAPGWLSKSPRPILWIGGRQNRRGVSWVSSFALDLIDALQMERSVEVVYTLCSGGEEGPMTHPLDIFKRAILQLLKSHPELVLASENLDKMSLQRFKAIGDSAEKAYKVLADILKMVNAKCRRNGKELFLVIDRVDIVLTRENALGRQRFLRALMQLNVEYSSLRVVLTSQFPVTELEFMKLGRDSLTEIWVDTTKPLAMYSR